LNNLDDGFNRGGSSESILKLTAAHNSKQSAGRARSDFVLMKAPQENKLLVLEYNSGSRMDELEESTGDWNFSTSIVCFLVFFVGMMFVVMN